MMNLRGAFAMSHAKTWSTSTVAAKDRWISRVISWSAQKGASAPEQSVPSRRTLDGDARSDCASSPRSTPHMPAAQGTCGHRPFRRSGAEVGGSVRELLEGDRPTPSAAGACHLQRRGCEAAGALAAPSPPDDAWAALSKRPSASAFRRCSAKAQRSSSTAACAAALRPSAKAHRSAKAAARSAAIAARAAATCSATARASAARSARHPFSTIGARRTLRGGLRRSPSAASPAAFSEPSVSDSTTAETDGGATSVCGAGARAAQPVVVNRFPRAAPC
mmetsp:Transcript_18496/g.53499  ORF Transcript_18496/g.53499 Transcript_18496/m.53499 type:complete len:277 (+) Transcript_18496:2012-2842(+)